MSANQGGGNNVAINAPQGDPEALMQLADQLDQHATNVGDLGANTLTTTQSISSAADWTGSAANAYGTFTGSAAHAVTGFENPLRTVATSIRTYAGVLKNAQQQVAGAVNTANGNIKANPASSQTEVAAAQKTASAAESDVQKAGDQAAGEIGEDKSAFDEFLEKLKGANEWAHVPFDVGATDMWLDGKLDSWVESLGDKANEASNDLGKTLQQAFDDQVGSIAHDFDNGDASMTEVESAFAKFSAGADSQAAAAAAKISSLDTLAGAAKTVGSLSKVMGGLAIVGDVVTIIKPEDSGLAGNVDRVAAAGNAVGTGAVLLALNAGDAVPVWGEAMAAGTGLYLAGDFLYHNVPAFHDACNAVGHGVTVAADAVGSHVASAGKAVASGFSSAAHAVASWF